MADKQEESLIPDLETLTQELGKKQEQIEQEVFYVLNSTDRILNLIRENLQAMTEVSVWQDCLCLALEEIEHSLLLLEEEETRKKQEFVTIRESINQVIHLLESGGESVGCTICGFQEALNETEQVNQRFHLLEEGLMEYFQKNKEGYRFLNREESE